MKILKDLQPIFQNTSVITIGSYDGVHLGHQQVLKRVTEIASTVGGETSVITFDNHPSEVLRPGNTIPLICSIPHRLKLFEQAGISSVYLLHFTAEFAQQSAEQFLTLLRSHLKFSELVLGHDATIGRAKEGDQITVQNIARKLSFKVEYLPPYACENVRVSSSAIRASIQKGDFAHVQKLLGRPYSIYAQVSSGKMHGKKIGFPTMNLDIQDLCLPPLGVYAVRVKLGTQTINGVANLGFAPTIRDDQQVILEVHLLDWQDEVYGQMVEVLFCSFLRPERKFASVEELVKQIKVDVQEARSRL